MPPRPIFNFLKSATLSRYDAYRLMRYFRCRYSCSAKRGVERTGWSNLVTLMSFDVIPRCRRAWCVQKRYGYRDEAMSCPHHAEACAVAATRFGSKPTSVFSLSSAPRDGTAQLNHEQILPCVDDSRSAVVVTECTQALLWAIVTS